MRISDFEWDEGNALHLELGHGITTDEAEEVFLDQPLSGKLERVIMRFSDQRVPGDI